MVKSSAPSSSHAAADQARFVRDQMPEKGLFTGHEWRVAPEPFPLPASLVRRLERLGRMLLQFYRASDRLYRQSAEGKQPDWPARWLDKGKPQNLIALQRSSHLKHDLPRIIRPDLLLTEEGASITELDSIPGGIGLTAWLNRVYSQLGWDVIGGTDGMMTGFSGIFGESSNVHIVMSEESATYRPEMNWLIDQLNQTLPASDGARMDGKPHPKHRPHFTLQEPSFSRFKPGDAVYRFFELFDLKNVPAAESLFAAAEQNEIRLTPPPKTVLEEKMLLALLWNRNLREYWRQNLGNTFFEQLLDWTPYTWVIDPTPLPPHGAIPELNLTGWHQLKSLSQRQRELILKVSGFSDKAWGARGVYLGSDLSVADWSVAVDRAVNQFEQNPFILQRYHKPKSIPLHWFDFDTNDLVPMNGRVRLCPYYFVSGDGDAAQAHLGGVLATICPSDKKIIHGMSEAIMAPCRME